MIILCPLIAGWVKCSALLWQIEPQFPSESYLDSAIIIRQIIENVTK